MQFYFPPGDESQGETGHFYALATTTGTYRSPSGNEQAAELVIYFSPSKDFSRFSLYAFNDEGRCVVYHRGPDYTPSAEAMLMELSLPNFGVPPYVWSLVSITECTGFFCSEHEQAYKKARHELSRALFSIRHHSFPSYGPVEPFFVPAGQWLPVNPNEPTEENSEIFHSAVG